MLNLFMFINFRSVNLLTTNKISEVNEVDNDQMIDRCLDLLCMHCECVHIVPVAYTGVGSLLS
jgi:hypothetical protein